jgi:hypothetical protein
MTLQMWFWLFYVAGLFFGLWHWYTPSQPYPWRSGAWTIFVMVLIGIVGYGLFRGPLRAG